MLNSGREQQTRLRSFKHFYNLPLQIKWDAITCYLKIGVIKVKGYLVEKVDWHWIARLSKYGTKCSVSSLSLLNLFIMQYNIYHEGTNCYPWR